MRGKRRRCLRVRHHCPCAFPRGRSTGLGVAGFAGFALAVDGIDHGRRLEARTGRSERAYEAARQPGSDALKKDGLGPGFPWVRF